MALETLMGVKEIDGEPIIVMDELRENDPELFSESGAMDYKVFEEKIRPYNHIYIRHDKNSITFTLQNGPIEEFGKNGCQWTALVEAAILILRKFNEQYPCRENAITLTNLETAMLWQRERTRLREKRGVEGYSKI